MRRPNGPMSTRWASPAVLLMLVAAVALAVPALAQTSPSAWSQAGGNSASTYQSAADGPTDPGLKWIQNLDELTSETAPDGFSVSEGRQVTGRDDQLVFGPEGTIILRARAEGKSVGEGNTHLIGVDPDDGSLAWNTPFAQTTCTPAVDSQGRGWGLFVDGVGQEGSFTGVTDPLIQAFDTATGQRDPASALEPVTDVEPEVRNWCRETSIHIGGAGSSERAILFDGRGTIGTGSPGIVAIDISGEQAAPAWVIAPDAATAPFDRVMRRGVQERIGAMNDDSLYIPAVTAGALELIELSLVSGEVTNRVALPIYDEEAGTAADIADVEMATVLLDGDTAVISVATRTSTSGIGALHGVDVDGDWVAPAWSRPFDDQASTQRGPRTIALAGSNVISASGVAVDTLYVRDSATGEPAAWSNTSATLQDSRQPSQYVTDATGNSYVATRGPSGDRSDRSITAYAPDGQQVWRLNRAGLLDASGLTDDVDGLKFVFDVRAIDAQGTLYLMRDDQLVAIDDSGGLAIPTFVDVPTDAPFFEEVEWAVQNEITDGFPDGEFKPTRSVSRQAAIAWLFRWVNPDGDWSEQAVERFSDVSSDSAFANEIGWAVEVGVTDGFPDGEFKPTAEVTRRALAAWFFRLAGAPELAADGIAAYDAFIDIEPDSPFVDEIGWMVANGITTGFPDETFRPGNDSSRQASTAFLFRFDQGQEDLIQ
ncbi:MAG: S-layer homology domain-containing protein [Nitriliruptor sp.]|nr:MAG: S-layer homology domain-containing protein [Nitriliruptor sp.]